MSKSNQPMKQLPTDIPDQFKVDPIEQRTYLIDGKMHNWNGEVADVFSSIHTEKDGERQPTRLGSIPSLGESEAIAAVDELIEVELELMGSTAIEDRL